MHDNRIQICYNAWTFLPLRLHDRYLMEDFAAQNFSRQKLEQLNACCMYLQVTTLAEVTDHTGTELLPQVFLTSVATCPKGLDTISQSTLQWPQIALPLISCWRTWSRTVRTLYTGSRNGSRLQHAMGAWLPTFTQHRFWHWRMPTTDHLLFRHTPTATTRVGLQTQGQ